MGELKSVTVGCVLYSRVHGVMRVMVDLFVETLSLLLPCWKATVPGCISIVEGVWRRSRV